MKRSRIDLRIRADEKETFMQEAKKRGLSISEMIRRAVHRFLEETPPPSRKSRG